MAAVLLDDDPDSKCENNALIREGSETRQGREGEGSRLISYRTLKLLITASQSAPHPHMCPIWRIIGTGRRVCSRVVLIYLILMVLTQLLAVKHREQ